MLEAFEKSEKIRREQKDLIMTLKRELARSRREERDKRDESSSDEEAQKQRKRSLKRLKEAKQQLKTSRAGGKSLR